VFPHKNSKIPLRPEGPTSNLAGGVSLRNENSHPPKPRRGERKYCLSQSLLLL
jgi:hypothetical protein